MKFSIKQVIQEEVVKALQANEEVVKKTVSLDMDTIKAIESAVELALSSGHRTLNGIDCTALLEKLMQLAHQTGE